jgi:hypothetical protein
MEPPWGYPSSVQREHPEQIEELLQGGLKPLADLARGTIDVAEDLPDGVS